jgi:hypothetical protein
MQKGRANVVHPYYFQAILAAKGGENGEEFASGEGAYPYCWFRFTLNSLCEGASFNGQSGVASHPVIDKMYKVHSAFANVCNACRYSEEEQEQHSSKARCHDRDDKMEETYLSANATGTLPFSFPAIKNIVFLLHLDTKTVHCYRNL